MFRSDLFYSSGGVTTLLGLRALHIYTLLPNLRLKRAPTWTVVIPLVQFKSELFFMKNCAKGCMVSSHLTTQTTAWRLHRKNAICIVACAAKAKLRKLEFSFSKIRAAHVPNIAC